METIVAVTLAVALTAVILLWARDRRTTLQANLDGLKNELASLAQRFEQDHAGVAARLEGIDTRLSGSQNTDRQLTANIFKTLEQVRGATEQVVEQARQFSTLQDVLRPPQARGALGEAMLEELLRQVLPPRAYALQHRFRNGAQVDAVVRTAGRLVCIDSKFPLANHQRIAAAGDDTERARAERAFARDVVQHIDAIASRYILPDEDTFDFALMYVPAEGVYHELLRLSHNGRYLYEIATERRVVPVSPLTIYCYLQTILFGLRCMTIEDGARAILDFCGRLQQDVDRFAEEYEVLGRHLGNASKRYEDGDRSLHRLRTDLERVAELERGAASADAAPDDGSARNMPAAPGRRALEVVSDA